MKNWVIIFAILGIVVSVAAMVYALRGSHASRRHAVAGAVATFNLGFFLLVNQLFDLSFAKSDRLLSPHFVKWVIEAVFLAAALAFFVLEIRLWKQHRNEIIGQ